MHFRSRINGNSPAWSARIRVAAVGLMLCGGGSAALAEESQTGLRGVSAVAHASATIVDPTSIRAERLYEAGDDFGNVDGLAVEPASIVRRECGDGDRSGRCNLIILDLP